MTPRLDFLVIGAQKCGTTWLHERLRRIPGIYLPPDKEFEYLSFGAHLEDPGWTRAFAARFTDAGPDDVVGDACVSYLWTTQPRQAGFNPDIPGTARRLFGGELRVVVLLRDPVRRAASAWLHHLRHGSLDWNTPLLAAPDDLGLVEMGRFGEQVADWAAALGPERVRVLPAPGDMPAGKLVAAACEFLGVAPPGTETDETVVYPGIQRRRDDQGGIWIRLNDAALGNTSPLKRPLPLEEVDGEAWVRIIHPAELAAVRRRLAPDTARLREWLLEQGQAEGFDWLGNL